VFPARTAVIYGERRWSYREYFERVCRMANALRGLGVRRDTKVAVLAPNTPLPLEAHAAIPMAGGVIVTLNIRLHANEIAYILNHSGSEVLLADAALSHHIAPIRSQVPGLRHVVIATDEQASPAPPHEAFPGVAFEEWLADAAADAPDGEPAAEEQVIAINYTSGTTGPPKGVVFTHRGAFLNALGNALQYGLNGHSVYLWTVPMFHCNGWCFTWTVPGVAGTSVCLRKVDGVAVREAIARHGVTHFCGAPVVLQFLASLPGAEHFRFRQAVRAITGGAAPSPTLLAAMRRMNVDVAHIYGLTETYGPYTVCEVQDDWGGLTEDEYAKRLARQGVANILAGELEVMDERMRPVPRDGATTGEICMRGHLIMKEYFREPAATAKTFADGWFRSGDLGVRHPDGYIELMDRAKDIIVSGGENISTIEVENVLASHPDVEEVAVVSAPDEQWGEVPVAFVRPRAGAQPAEQELIAYARERLAHYKCPKRIVFGELPRTSTGKVQKYVLRERLWQGQARRIKGH
jgi:fatty-acyl-CoA synthase